MGRSRKLSPNDPPEEPPPAPAFVEYAQHVIDTRLKATLAKGTLGLYGAALRALRGFYGANGKVPATPLNEVSVGSFLDYRAYRMGVRNSTHGDAKSVSARTVNADQQFACRILNEAVLDGHIDQNPLAGLKKLKEPRRPRRYLTKDEIGRLIDACPKDLRPLVVAMVYTGARRSDRGPPMISKPVAFLLADLGVTKSHSRPYTSNDNPFSESHFRTSCAAPRNVESRAPIRMGPRFRG